MGFFYLNAPEAPNLNTRIDTLMAKNRKSFYLSRLHLMMILKVNIQIEFEDLDMSKQILRK